MNYPETSELAEDHLESLIPAHVGSSLGNITSLTTSNDATSWEFASPLGPKRNIVYDVRNMPVAIQMRTGDTLFKYDGNGNRVQKYSPEGVVTYVTDTYEIRGMQNIALYLGNVRFAEFDGDKATYFLRDHINSASVSMDEHGTVSETAEYLPFGSPRLESLEITSTDYTFTDQEKDRSTGLFNYDARHYDPRTGRFVSPDSILPDPYDPQQLNRYAYARNNPLRYTDPSGHVLDTFIDIVSLSISIMEFARNPTWQNAGWVVVDAVALATPGLPGTGVFRGPQKVLAHSADEIAERAAAAVGREIKEEGTLLTGKIAGEASSNIPSKVNDVLSKIKANNGAPPKGYKGGRLFENDGRNGSTKLPSVDKNGNQISYREYDVNPYQKGNNRGLERIVRGNDGSSYYTSDHYETFTKIE